MAGCGGPAWPARTRRRRRKASCCGWSAAPPPPASAATTVAAFAAGLDRALAVPPGFFPAWLRRHGRRGGRNKVPRVVNDEVLLDDLVAAAERADR